MSVFTSKPGRLSLRSIGSFHLGGQRQVLSGLPSEQIRLAVGAAPRTVDPNGSYMTGQVYVQYYLQQEPVSATPIVLWHGGGMTGANWESTPDGRAGWLQRLLERGFDVFVCDAVERGRAGWSRWPEIYKSPPLFRTIEEGWDMFRLGPPSTSPGNTSQGFEGQQFPIGAFEEFAAQWVPRWADHEEMTLRAYELLLRKIGRSVLIAHSQGGGLAFTMAARCPELLDVVIAVEPSGAPTDASEVSRRPSHFVVWGDYIDGHPIWRNYRARVDQYMELIGARGATTATIDLPKLGVSGNSHFPMLDRNSDQVLQMILERAGLNW